MNIEIDQSTGGFEVPYEGDWTLRISSPFTEGELAGGTFVLYATGPDDATQEVPGFYEGGTDILFTIPARTFTPGLWELNPSAVIGGRTREFAVAIGCNVLSRGVSRWPAHGGQAYPFQ